MYGALLNCFRDGPQDPTLEHDFTLANRGADDEMELLHGLRELRNVNDIIGDMAIIPDCAAEFTDSEDNSDKDLDGMVEVYGNFTDSEDE